MVVWIIGLSGAGKTTVGEALLRQWRRTAANTILVDGDAVRTLFATAGDEVDHSLAGRRRNAGRTIALCEWLDRQGMNVICCQLSLFEELRAVHRQRVSGYLEVWLDTPWAVVTARDSKGFYAKALAGEIENVVGVDIPFPRFVNLDLVLDGSGAAGDADALAASILARLEGRSP